MITFNRFQFQIDNAIGSVPTARENAPVTRVQWSCDNLPDGLTLSKNGILYGRPNVTGSFDCDVFVHTNWGYDRNTLHIQVIDA